MTEQERKTFFNTFPPTILADIIKMVDDDNITRAIGKRLLGVYIDTHKVLVKYVLAGGKSDEFGWKQTFDKFFELEFGEEFKK